MTDQREAVAEAIWQAGYGRHRKNRRWPDDVLGGSQELFRDMADAALAAMGEREVRVKPLDWDKHPDDDEWYGNDRRGQCELTGQNHYNVFPHPLISGWFNLEIMGHRTNGVFPSASDAKAAAQADYERRIRSALEVGEREVTVSEAAQVLIDAFPEEARPVSKGFFNTSMAHRALRALTHS